MRSSYEDGAEAGRNLCARSKILRSDILRWITMQSPFSRRRVSMGRWISGGIMSSVKGTEQVIKNLSHIEKSIVQEIVYGAQAVQAKLINDARANVPVGVTGALSASIQPGAIIVTDDNVEAFVEANVDYASFLEFGTRPH